MLIHEIYELFRHNGEKSTKITKVYKFDEMSTILKVVLSSK